MAMSRSRHSLKDPEQGLHRLLLARLRLEQFLQLPPRGILTASFGIHDDLALERYDRFGRQNSPQQFPHRALDIGLRKTHPWRRSVIHPTI